MAGIWNTYLLMLIFLRNPILLFLEFDLPMCGNEQVVIFTPKYVQFEMLASSYRCQMKKSSCSFNMVKLTVNERCCLIGRLIGMLNARMWIHVNIDPNWAMEVCK